MTAHDADDDELRADYSNLIAFDHRPEGRRYTATLADGTPVVVVALADSISDAVSSVNRFFQVMESAASVRHAGLTRPVRWGQAPSGMLHCAYVRSDAIDIVP